MSSHVGEERILSLPKFPLGEKDSIMVHGLLGHVVANGGRGSGNDICNMNMQNEQ